MAKRILRAMQIMELSAVDNPAQEGATFVLAKRAKEEMALGDKPADKPGSGAVCGCDKPKPNEAGTKCEKCGKPMPSKMCDGTSNQGGPTVKCDKCGKMVAEAGSAGEKCGQCGKTVSGKCAGLTDPPASDASSNNRVLKSGEDTMTDAEKLAKAETDLASEKAKGEKLTKVAALSDVEKDHYAGLVEIDEAGAVAFLDMPTTARAVEIEKAKNADPVIYTDSEGHEYHKSEAKAASLAKRADDMAKENKALREAGESAAFEKRAGEFPHLKGDTVAKVALLRAVDGVADEATRTAITEMLKANDAGLAEAMKTLGTKAGLAPSAPEAALNKMAEDKAKAEKITFAKAYDTVVQTPEGEKLYRELIEAKMPKVAA